MFRYVLCCLMALIAFGATAQSSFSVKDVLGYEVGDRFSHYHDVVNYFEYVAANSELVELIPYGETYEHRKLYTVAVSSGKNIGRLDEIRKNNLINVGFEKGDKSGGELPIIWLSYNIHGDEASGTEAALMTLEKLVSGNAEIDKWLDDVVVIIDPCQNPDGRERYVNWYYQVQNSPPNPNLNSWEHQPIWPGGRFNHYLFDLNRDWAWQSQIETRQKIHLYQQWMPQVHVDLHEMGHNQPYFFGPAARPYHEDITEWQKQFQVFIGASNARYFDEKGWLYYTKEIFDLFYPSYGDTWPIFNGAVGFTYEQGGSRRAGVAVITERGDTLSLKERAEHHMTTSLSSIQTTWQHREQLLDEFKQYFKSAVSDPPGKYKSYVVKMKGQSGRVKSLVEFLDRAHIDYGFSGSGKSMTGFSYLTGHDQSFSIELGDLIINSAQPSSRLLKVLFEPRSNLEDSLTYDLTAWSIPYAYGLNAYACKSKIGYDEGFETEWNIPIPYVENAPYAYISHWTDSRNVTFLAALLKNNVKVRFSKKEFQMGEHNFGKGSLVINRTDNKHIPNFDKLVVDLANKNENSGKLYTVFSGLSKRGSDLGSGSLGFIIKPNIALIAGDGISPSSFGELWYYFEQVIKYPVAVLKRDDLTQANLSDFDVVVMPSGSYNDSHRGAILNFVRNGGKVIAIDRAVASLANAETNLAEVIKDAKSEHADAANTNGLLNRFEDRERGFLQNSVEGSIYKVYLDDSHPLSFGEDASMHLIKRNSTPYPFIKKGWNVGVYKADSHTSGFIGHQLKKKLVNTLAIGVENHGAGEIIYMPDSPVFRGFWYSGNLILGNAVFLVGR